MRIVISTLRGIFLLPENKTNPHLISITIPILLIILRALFLPIPKT
ncbi:GRP family sugar transporter [Priestia megaterium]|nr:GRP family sugar transporter [Priestia megaterium]